jgi:hypothetical protein
LAPTPEEISQRLNSTRIVFVDYIVFTMSFLHVIVLKLNVLCAILLKGRLSVTSFNRLDHHDKFIKQQGKALTFKLVAHPLSLCFHIAPYSLFSKL